MVSIRKAVISDLNPLLKLIETINDVESRYLRYDKESHTLRNRLLSNIKQDHVVLFLTESDIFGFFEYSIQEQQRIWVYSLYFKQEHRTKTFKLMFPIFTGMRESYKLPIHFTVAPENKVMQAIVKFLHAEPVSEYEDGRIEYCVKEDTTW